MTKEGFTLIELSIVLVILSLVVGGIVGGRSLIEAARIQSVAREMNAISTAVNAFKLQFDARPGDFTEATVYWPDADTQDGDGDRFYDFTGASFGHEMNRAWQHLELAEIFITGVHGGAGPAVPGLNHLASDAVDNSGWQFESSQAFYGAPPYRSNYVFHGRQHGSWLDAGALHPRQARAVDRKMDDGIASDGDLRGKNGHAPGDGGCIQSDDYDLDDTDSRCLLLFWLEGRDAP